METRFHLRDIPEWAKSMTFSEKICAARGLEKDKIEQFLNPILIRKKIHPKDEFPAIEEAAEFLTNALKKKKKILIWGDYDTDGIMASAILSDLFKDRVEYAVHIPERQDGYGLKMDKLIEVCKDFKPDMLVTVDCGITACEEIAWAKKNGIATLVTDHHISGKEIPNADALCDPILGNSGKYKYLCGAGVAWLLANLVQDRINDAIQKNRNEWILYAGIATVADIVPLYENEELPWNVNRFIVRKALDELKKITRKPSRHFGLSKLLTINDSNPRFVPSSYISFVIAPCINAAGRMTSPLHAYKMITEKSVEEAEYCIQQNGIRKHMEAEKVVELLEKIPYERSVLFDTINIGLLGLLAGRITERRAKPTILLTEINDRYQGSGRAPDGYDLYDLLSQCSDLLIGFGGHQKAAGCMIEKNNLEAFRQKFSDLVDAVPTSDYCDIYMDMELTGKDINFDNLNDLHRMEPMSQAGNPEPLFYMKNCKIDNLTLRGVNSQHLLFRVETSNGDFFGKKWNAREEYSLLKRNPVQNIAFKMTDPYFGYKPEIEVLAFLGNT